MTEKLTDQELYRKAKLYGKNALHWRRKFMGLLPEVARRRLYLAKGFGSVFEFSFKLAGLSEEQVRRVLNLEKKFTELPALKELLESGEVSVNKLVRVASIATPQNEAELAEQVKLLPNRALETLVRDERIQSENGLSKPSIEAKSVHVQSALVVHDLELNEDVLKRLSELKEKGLDLNELLLEFLQKREEEIAEEKAAIAANLPETQSRPIPTQTKKVLNKEHGTKCTIPICHKPSEQIHHTQTYALSRRHDPHYLAPLCREHHIIAHSINVKVQEKRREVLNH